MSERRSPKKRKDAPIAVSVSEPSSTDPVLISFPRGLPISIIEEDEGDLPKFKCRRLNSKRGLVVTGEDDTCTYSATAEGRGHDGRLTKTYVCVLDKKARTLKLVPAAEKGTIFALNQTVKEYTPNVKHGTRLVGDGNVGDSGTSATDRVKMLVESFGSKKKQKVMKSRAANRVNINAVVGAGTLMAASVAKQEGISEANRKGMEEGGEQVNPSDAALDAARRNLLPPFNEKAEKPFEVYDAETIIGTSAWTRVSRIVTKKVVGESEQMNTDDLILKLMGKINADKFPSIRTLMGSINMSKTSGTYKMKVAFYVYLATKFNNMLGNRGEIRGKTLDDCIHSCHLPHDVGYKLFETFGTAMQGDREGYQVSKPKRDSLLVQILILYVMAHGKRMKVSNLGPIFKDLNIRAKEGVERLRQAGFECKKSNSTGEYDACLNVPLTFPRPKLARR